MTGRLFDLDPPPDWAGGEVMPSSEWCQRWRGRGHTWRHRSEGGFDRDIHRVEPLGKASAREFVLAHHYLGSFSQAQRCFGLYRRGELAGVAVFGVPGNQACHTGPFPELHPNREVTTLTRLVVLDLVEANGESFFVSRCLKALAAEGWRAVVAQSDPVPRTTTSGKLVFPGHVGTIYQATAGAVYWGRARAKPRLLLPDGTVLPERSLQKVRGQERGAGGMERFLVDRGARPKTWRDEPHAWLAEALEAVGARSQRHGGNHRYAWPLRRDVAVALGGQSWPKMPDDWMA
jgi:hypothetical protein